MTAAMGKAQADGAASASASENTIAGRLIGNRIDRLQKRVGQIKTAAPGRLQVNGQSYTTGMPPEPPEVASPPPPMTGPPAPGRLQVNGNDSYITGTAGVPGSIDPETGRTAPKPFRHLAPESGQMLNNHAGANALFPRLGLYRASYGALGDTMFDWMLKKRLTTPQPPRYMRESDMVNSPDRMGIISQIYGNQITTDPRLAAAQS